jgi:hypothetical protein
MAVIMAAMENILSRQIIYLSMQRDLMTAGTTIDKYLLLYV